MRKTIRVSDIIGSPICVSTEDGQKLFDVICQAISDNVQLEVSFEGIELIISAFLNVAIGQIYGTVFKEKVEDAEEYIPFFFRHRGTEQDGTECRGKRYTADPGNKDCTRYRQGKLLVQHPDDSLHHRRGKEDRHHDKHHCDHRSDDLNH